MIPLPAFKTWLQSQGVTDAISFGEQPEDPSNCYTLFNSGRIGTETERAYERPTIQVLTRGASGTVAYGMAEAIDDLLLDAPTPFALDGRQVNAISNVSGPIELGRDGRNRIEYTANYWISIARM